MAFLAVSTALHYTTKHWSVILVTYHQNKENIFHVNMSKGRVRVPRTIIIQNTATYASNFDMTNYNKKVLRLYIS